jgi:CTD small phosphatase-like protein 2
VHIKDLSKLGRPLEKTVIIDNLEENFQLQPNNGILIKSWFYDEEDDVLSKMTPILQQIAWRELKDIRKAIEHYHKNMARKIAIG